MKKIRSATGLCFPQLHNETAGGLTYGSRDAQLRIMCWAYERGLSFAQRQHFKCGCALLGLRYGNRFGWNDHACGFSGGGQGLSFLDHVTVWNRERKAVVVLAQPYGSADHHRTEATWYAEFFGLDVIIGDKEDATYLPDRCIPIRFELGASLTQLERHAYIRKMRRRRDVEEILTRELRETFLRG